MPPVIHPAVLGRSHGLRATLGVRSPAGWLSLSDGSLTAWRQFPARDTQGQPIVCLHSIGSGSREFHPLLDHLPAGCRLILIDWPGHGRSESEQPPTLALPLVERTANHLHSVINQLGLKRPILLGTRFGGAVALRYAADHPARILGLVLCQPAGLISADKEHSLASKAALQFRKLLPKSSMPISPAQRQALRVRAVRPEMLPVLAESQVALQRAQLNLPAALRTVPCPILFAFSRSNPEFKLKKYLSLLDPLLAAAPQHTFTVFNGSQNPIWDEPVRFAQALTSFVQAQLPLHLHHHAWQLTAVDWPTADSNLWKCVHPACPEERVVTSGENPNQPDS